MYHEQRHRDMLLNFGIVLALLAFCLFHSCVAQAADKMSKAGVPAGTYCEVIEPDLSAGWMYFTRGKCAPGSELTTLILKTNGDFIFTGEVGDEKECKVNPKSYFKGWADYNCKTYGGSVMKSKHNYKFTTHGPGTLGLSGLD